MPGQPGLLETLLREMRLRNYSHKTMKAYQSCIRLFARHFRPKHPRQINVSEIRGYLGYLMQDKGYAAATINQVLNALRFLYVELYKCGHVIHLIRLGSVYAELGATYGVHSMPARNMVGIVRHTQ